MTNNSDDVAFDRTIFQCVARGCNGCTVCEDRMSDYDKEIEEAWMLYMKGEGHSFGHKEALTFGFNYKKEKYEEKIKELESFLQCEKGPKYYTPFIEYVLAWSLIGCVGCIIYKLACS